MKLTPYPGFASLTISSHFDRITTNIMERLPTELMAEVVRYSDKPTIHSFTIVSSKYREIAQPHLFRHIYIKKMADERLALFVEQLENSNKLALMIKILSIKTPFTPELLRHLFTVVSNLEQLHIKCEVANFLLSSHYLPKLRRLYFLASTQGAFNDVVANFIPYHRVLDDLKVTFRPKHFTSDSATLSLPPLAESVSSGVDRLVTYQGPRSLLHLLTPNSRMKYLISLQQLDEGTLRKLSRAVSGGLSRLIIYDPTDPFKYETLPGPLIPSLFPTLRSIAWLSVDIQSTSVIDQLPHLRWVWFASRHAWKLPGGVEGFVSKIIELSHKERRPLREIGVDVQDMQGARPLSYRYSKASINSRWVLRTGRPMSPSFFGGGRV